MSFEEIVGNAPVKKRLEKMLNSGHVPHLLLFSGPDGVGKRLFAVTLAREWLCQISQKALFQKAAENIFHPDLQILRPEGKTGMLSIQSVRQVIETLYHSPYEAAGRAVVFDDAERMLPSSANALLKVLEEPPHNTLIILVSSRQERLLGTIRSRAQLMRFQPCTEEELLVFLVQKYNKTAEEALLLAQHAHGSIGKAIDQKKNDELEEALFMLLMELKNKNFSALSAACLGIQKMVEARRKDKEAALKEELPKITKEMAAAVRELIEHDIEGAVTLFWLQDIECLLVSIYAFYRDLVAIGSNHPSLYFAYKKEELTQAYNQGRSISLDRVDKLLQWAKQAVERYQPLQNVLETIFLQL